jgi:hypothetical protein|tara:strand:+ start:607 stop:1086 length:480 start_codon:yes stop_codon:yes gene_type:complete
MALESGTYIDSLNASNPATTDGLSQADDHMRLIKATIKATFPNVSGAVTLTHTEVNALDTRLDDLEGTGQYAPAIVRSSGTPALKSGITAAEIRDLIELGTSNSPTFTTVNATTIDLGDWTITENSGTLRFAYQGTVRMSLSSTGTLIAEGDITAFGSA